MYTTFLMPLLITIASQFPVLLVLGAGLCVVLFKVPPGPLRRLAVTALVILLVCNGLSGMLSMVAIQMARALPGTLGSDINTGLGIYRVAAFVFLLLRALGYGLLLLALVRALRAASTHSERTQESGT